MNINEVTPGSSVFARIKRKARKEDPTEMLTNRLPYLNWLPEGFRPHFVAMCGEFVGTWLFLFFAFAGTQIANTTQVGVTTHTSTSDTSLYIAFSFGFSLVVNAWVFFRISGGLFNPAVTFGMCLVGALTWFRGGLLFVAQMLGALCSAAVVSALFPGDLAVQTTLGGGTSIVQGLFIEMFLTAELIFTIFMLAAEKHKATFIAPIGIGLSLFTSELTGVYFTGGSLNPARSFAPAVVLGSFPGYHWIYWLGPVLGAVLAAGFYGFIKMLEYETANPGQDEDDKEAKEYDPERDAGNHTPRYGSAPTNMPSSERSHRGSSRREAPRSHDRTLNRSPDMDAVQHIPSHEIPRRAVPGETTSLPVASQFTGPRYPAVNTTTSRNTQEQPLNRHSGQYRGVDSGRASTEHMWPEGQTADAAGQRTYV